jgi:hypothetical protein
MIFDSVKSFTLNIKGWHTRKKIVVIHSDDWGSIRMPSNSVREKLEHNSDIKLNNSYAKYDTLASSTDLEILFETLSSVKDKYDSPAILTANCLMANPDFEKIKVDNFQNYYYEHITDTFSRYNNDKALKLWDEGLKKKMFYPQFHGREHVNFPFWLEALRNNHIGVRQAFDYGTFGLSFKDLGYNQWNFQRAWDVLSPNSEQDISNSILEGLKMFEAYFGFKSLSAIAPNYTWSNAQEQLLKKEGVIAMQGMLKQRVVNGSNQAYNYKMRFTNSNLKANQILAYQRRNVFFEPSQNKIKDPIDAALRRINISFKSGKPAIIGSHRLNFIGGLNVKNRDDSIVLLKKLLKIMVKKWPDIQFMNAEDLARAMHKNKLQ